MLPASLICEDPNSPAATTTQSAPPLPAVVTGKVAFYAARYFPDGRKQTEVQHGPVTERLPLASAFKTMLLNAVLQDVDAGRLHLDQLFETTDANQSIEDFPPERVNSLDSLADVMIRRSDNTASDILHLAAAPQRVAELTTQLSPCTHLYLTTKAFWAALSGLIPDVIDPRTPETLRNSARAYAALPAGEKRDVAARINTLTQHVHQQQVYDGLDTYFNGPNYHPENDVSLLNSSTARAYSDLLAQLFLHSTLQPATQQRFRDILATGCCTKPSEGVPFPYRYWGAKAGSGWRLLTMTGFMELPDGSGIAYSYLNHESDVEDAEEIENQIRPVLNWIVSAITPIT
ncbi:serine hydrolase [Deinococcus ruber]|nr:serine hydrolase [Deinococcus ruber]